MLGDWFTRLPALGITGYAVTFLAALLEALPAIGLVIPGQTIIILAAFAAQRGALAWPLVFGLAALGAILGDLLGYWLGRRYGVALLGTRGGMVAEAKALLRAHPRKTLVFGRFNSLARAFAPFAAGASKLKFRKFMIANIAGGILWAATWTGVGLLLGAGYGFLTATLEAGIVIAFALACGLLVCYHLLRRRWGISRVALLLTLAAAIGLIGFTLLVNGLGREPLRSLDALGPALLAEHTLPIATALVFSALGSTLCFAFLVTMPFLWLVATGARRSAFVFGIAVLGGVVLSTLVKDITLRPRPTTAVTWMVTTGTGPLATMSFPSGHAVLAVVTFGGIALALRRSTSAKHALALVCALFTGGIALSRLALGVHYLSDVLGGLCLGLFWLGIVYLLDEALRARAAAPRPPPRAGAPESTERMKRTIAAK